MISCSDAVKQLWAYLDGSVDETDKGRIEEHLSVCRRCCGELEFAEELRAFLGENASDDLPPDVRGRLQGFLEDLT
jgi:mycothiol system anti-sigma-R factor